jgi:hypothetical protein
MVEMDNHDNVSYAGHPQFHAGAGTQDAACALMGLGFGVASGDEKQLTPHNKLSNKAQKKYNFD